MFILQQPAPESTPSRAPPLPIISSETSQPQSEAQT